MCVSVCIVPPLGVALRMARETYDVAVAAGRVSTDDSGATVSTSTIANGARHERLIGANSYQLYRACERRNHRL